MGTQFSFDEVDKLDSDARRQLQPPSRLVELIASWQPGRVLDLGVGTGFVAVPLAKRLPETTIIGVDREPRMFRILEERAVAAGVVDQIRAIAVSPAEGAKLPLPDDGVDAALLVALYHELDDRAASLGELRRVLRPGGRLVVCDWSPTATDELGPPLAHRVPVETVQAELVAAGFESPVSHAFYSAHYTLVAERAT